MNEIIKQNQAQMTAPIDVGESSIFSSLQKFQEVQQMSEYLASSDLVPKEFQKKPANVMIALGMANRMKADPFMVMQNLYIVHGRPSWASQFLIACVNSSGKFSSLQYEFQGSEGKNDWGCRAFATELSTGEKVCGPFVTIQIAINEGWMGRNGSKWKTMPELMLTYRAAAFFVRTKAPEISMGMHTDDEVRDMGDAVVVETSREYRANAAQKLIAKSTANKCPPKKAAKEEPQEDQSDCDIDIVQFIKMSIDTCTTIDTLEECGNDIKVKFDDNELTEFQLREVKKHYAAALKTMKSGK